MLLMRFLSLPVLAFVFQKAVGAKIPCGPFEFKCSDGECIPISHKCDGEKDCDGEEDEQNCTTRSTPPEFLAPRVTNKENTIALFTIGQTGAKLICSATGELPLTFGWFKNTMPINGTREPNTEEYTLETVNGTSTLEFLNVNINTAGSYTCVAKNHYGNDSATFQVGTDERSGLTTVEIILISIAVIVAIGVIALVWFVGLKTYHHFCGRNRALTDEEILNFRNGNPTCLDLEDPNFELLPFDKKHEVSWDNLHIYQGHQHKLGSGNFGSVYEAKNISSNEIIAAKVVKSSVDREMRIMLLSEIKIMIAVGQHENVVGFCGACIEIIGTGRCCGACFVQIGTGSVCLLMELCSKSLLEALRSSNFKQDGFHESNSDSDSGGVYDEDLEEINLLIWAQQIASGMDHLSKMKIVHGDLASRNVLLKGNVVKLSDFGLSKKLYETETYQKKSKCKFPFQWMALETLTEKIFSKKSDVWSYGVTLWEMYALGKVPFQNERWNQHFITKLAQGERLPRPDNAKLQVYSIMKDCWNIDPDLRPDFTHLKGYFQGLINQASGDRQSISEEESYV